MRNLAPWTVKADRIKAMKLWFKSARFVTIPCGDCASVILDYHHPDCSIHKLAS